MGGSPVHTSAEAKDRCMEKHWKGHKCSSAEGNGASKTKFAGFCFLIYLFNNHLLRGYIGMNY
jgi:hypothetical protein